MFDALTKLFEGKNINRNMTLRNQLKNVKIQNAEIVMTTLNGLRRSWDSFIQGFCARKKLVKFSRLWKEWSQEEAWIAAQEEKMGSEDQALTVQSKKTRTSNHRGKHSHQRSNFRNPRYMPKYICYTCDEDTLLEIVLETKVALTRIRETRKDIMLMLQRMMNLPQRKSDKTVMILQVMKNMF